jgi:hypothetical protein
LTTLNYIKCWCHVLTNIFQHIKFLFINIYLLILTIFCYHFWLLLYGYYYSQITHFNKIEILKSNVVFICLYRTKKEILLPPRPSPTNHLGFSLIFYATRFVHYIWLKYGHIHVELYSVRQINQTYVVRSIMGLNISHLKKWKEIN